jgi:hypothetical protein
MQKQKVFFFAAKADDGDSLLNLDDLRNMAANYIRIYGESCLNDPETPSFVRRLMKSPASELPQAG